MAEDLSSRAAPHSEARRRFLLNLLSSSAGLLAGCTTIREAVEPDQTVVTSIGTSSGPFIAPALPFGLNQVLVTGQSLSTGVYGAPSLSTTQTLGNLMFNVGARLVPNGNAIAPVNPVADLASLLPLIEQDADVSGETICSAFANRLATRLPGKRFLLSVDGVGGKPYTSLERGTIPYNNGLLAARAAQTLYPAAGFGSSGLAAILLVHGETDEQQGNRQYAANLAEWIADLNADLSAITGQTLRMPMLQSQIACGWAISGGASNNIPQQQLDASTANPGLIPMVCPKYMLPYRLNDVHLVPAGYRWLGEYYARVLEWMLAGNAWYPVSPQQVTLNATRTQMVVDFHVPVPPLVFDTQLVTEPTSIPGQRYGFEVADSSGSPPAITGVAGYGSAGTSLLITLAGPLRSGARLRYAYSRPTQNGNPGIAGPTGDYASSRGNLRDSDPSPSLYGNTLYNWCVAFDYAIG